MVRTGFLARGRVESGASKKKRWELHKGRRGPKPYGDLKGVEGFVQRQDIKKSEEIGQIGKGLEARLKM